MEFIKIRNASIHNLKNINIDIPKGKLVVVTGVSGSGKSSLMFDLIFEEGRRLYLEKIGAITGLSVGENCDSIVGISPTVAVKQSITRQKNPRSTISSKTKLLKILSSIFSAYSEEYLNIQIDSSRFSYNNPKGMCMKCLGLGYQNKIHVNRVTNNKCDTLSDILKKLNTPKGTFNYFDRHFGEKINDPFKNLDDETAKEFLYGHYVENNTDHRSFCLERILSKQREKGIDVQQFYSQEVCSQCNGKRVNSEILELKIGGYNIGDLCLLTIEELRRFFQNFLDKNKSLSEYFNSLIEAAITELNAFIQLELGYLTLYRNILNLSGGEIQKIFLSDLTRSELSSIIYVLDEPLSGLHETEKEMVFSLIDDLKKQNNSILVVDHDPKMIERADFIIDIGPKAGVAGGKIMYTGDYEGLLNEKKSVTGDYLRIPSEMFKPRENKVVSGETNVLHFDRIPIGNLDIENLDIPLEGYLIGISGKSGCGKTMLINKLNNLLINEDKLREKLNIVKISQEPIGRSINSNLVTFVKIWDEIRRLYANQEEAKQQNLSQSDFSFNSSGACKSCNGTGRKAIEFGDGTKYYSKCLECDGKRYKENTLKIKYQGLNIYDVLNLQVTEAIKFFAENKLIHDKLQNVIDIGIGYVTLGQPTSTLSGGEAQRLKLAKDLGNMRNKKSIYLLDMPTVGLSGFDISELFKIFDKLTQIGHTVIVCEHNIEFLKRCDWLIELGDLNNGRSGKIGFQGSPAQLKDAPYSLLNKIL